MNRPVPTVFLDRDGVINRRLLNDYVTQPEGLEILPGVTQALDRLHKAGWRCAVVTNQRGIALGRMTRLDVDAIHHFLAKEVAAAGGLLTEFYVCPHDRHEGCPCRKPAPGLLDQAHAFRPVDWLGSWLVGDSDSDILAGKARNLRTIKVAGPGQADWDHLCSDLPAAVELILTHSAGS